MNERSPSFVRPRLGCEMQSQHPIHNVRVRGVRVRRDRYETYVRSRLFYTGPED